MFLTQAKEGDSGGLSATITNLPRDHLRSGGALREHAQPRFDFEICDAADSTESNRGRFLQNLSGPMMDRLDDAACRSVTVAAVACADSHRRAWVQLVEQKKVPAIILEDDSF